MLSVIVLISLTLAEEPRLKKLVREQERLDKTSNKQVSASRPSRSRTLISPLQAVTPVQSPRPTDKSIPTLYRKETFRPVMVLDLKETGNQVVGLVLF